MLMAELANCVRCNQVFVKTVRNICQDCYREEEEAFEKVYKFLSKRENREATLKEIVIATEVDEELIIKFIRENRLRTSHFPKLSYPCENCGIPIVSGKLCANCSESLLKAFERQKTIDKRQQQVSHRNQDRIDTYYTIDKREK